MHGIPALSDVQQRLRDAADGAIEKVRELDLAASTLAGRMIRLRKEAGSKLREAFKQAGAALARLSGQMHPPNAALP
ncbi:hypothetical protein, partial [Tritonibacter sp. SIMBA_163]|uniref:hypothetical protein n=1 Tax=Tritonibacter sp. SIMBA_163 TaxID=3080868 RepID=UPI00397EB420